MRHSGRALGRLRPARGGWGCGIVCDGSAVGAADALLELLRDPERARRLGEAGQTFAAAYRRENVVPELVALLERVANSSNTTA